MRNPSAKTIGIVLVLILSMSCSFLDSVSQSLTEGGESPSGGEEDQPPPPPPTPTPSPTPEPPTETPTPTETATITPTEGPNFPLASVYAVSHLDGGRLLVTIQVPGGVTGSYTATVASSNFTCEILPDYPDRLYCNGPEPYNNYSAQAATIQLYSATSTEPVFTGNFNIPPRATPTPTPSKTPKPTDTPFIIITLIPLTLIPFP